ncbi:hypothetical protein KFE25_002862 [Diacronema lutheri]|uniref:Uncharacterized protein n=1 Tax=Diacronema lutheri TaxID=2081491 RepID=A0A8J5XPB4_DIALT|nr:hypothetical protein KFE25_002862 [Diacronema lutheri]
MPSAFEATLTTLTAGLVGANAVLGVSFAAALLCVGAPFVPTARAKADAIFDASDGLLTKASAMLPASRAARELHVVDLGSGEGTIVRAAVRVGGYGGATGYEVNPALVALARLRSLGAGRREEHRCPGWAGRSSRGTS